MSLHSIMVVDDNTDMLSVYARVLAQEGFEVFTAATGKECLEQIETVQPDIFLMDVVLPDWNGVDLVREIKVRPAFAHSMFVLLSGLMTDSDCKIRGLDAGALDYLARPIPNKELVAKVKSLVKVMDFQDSLVALSKELDQCVTERTRELEVTVEALQREIESRRLLEEQFRHAQKMEAIGTLAGGIAHDFNNILQIISGNAYLKNSKDLARGERSPEIDQILEAVETASNMTQGLLAFSRRQKLDMHPLNLNDLMRQSVKLGQRLVEESVVITSGLCPDKLPVMADAGLIQQVFFNLITNARDAMNACGAITVRTSSETVTGEFPPRSLALPTIPTPGKYAVLSVTDTAAGIPDEIMEQIFDPFFTTKQSGEGTGLGLAMIHGTIIQHEGFIVVDTLPGSGTTFSMYLPLREQMELKEQGPVCSDIAPERPAQYTILVVEDEASVRELLVLALSSVGYRTIIAENGRQAVQIFRESQGEISLILMDIVMPEMTGKEAIDQIRKLNADVPCMFMTGYGAEVISRFDISLHDTIIKKPFNLPALLQKIRLLLEKSFQFQIQDDI